MTVVLDPTVVPLTEAARGGCSSCQEWTRQQPLQTLHGETAGPERPKWSRVVPSGPEWSRVVPSGPERAGRDRPEKVH